MYKIRLAALLAIITSINSYSAIADQSVEIRHENSNQNETMNSSNTTEQGKSLRQEVEEWRKRQSRDPMQGSAEVRHTIQKYIHAGISFDTAELILKEAGFEISRHHEAVRHPKMDYRDDVVGSLVLKEKFPSKRTLTVSLTPRTMGDYSEVGVVNTRVSVETL